MTDDNSPALHRAMQVFLAWKADPNRKPVTEFLAANDDLRHVLEPMLERDHSPEAGTADPPNPVPDDAQSSRKQIGPYRILSVLGEGGMGTVYLADQREPVRRRVALKVIKLGMASKQVLARFEQERQALAVMSHPTIAKVFEAGISEEGQPYFVMEYVEGIALTDYCDQHKLSLKERIEVFQQVCRGVQHAHQKGVIHRDLKPGNILVARKENEHAVKIIDFGVARATDHQLVDQTIFTEQGQIIGTPEYMSPEQASGAAMDIDTRTDVYSLGVVLYELLTGGLPFTSQELRKAGLMEIQRIIAEVEPPRPSARVSTLGGLAAESASRRRMSTHAWTRELRGDLDWIVLKAMAKEPERRYESATGLAMDLGRFLEMQPVLAGRPSALYRARKFVRRNRVSVTASVLIATAVVVGIVGVVAGHLEARAQRPQVDLYRSKQLIAQADQLWPAVPEKIEAMEEWLRKQALAREALTVHHAELQQLRGRAKPQTADEVRSQRETGPDAAELADLEWALAYQSRPGVDAATAEPRIQELKSKIAALEQKDTVRTFEFESDKDKARHDVLTELVETLEVIFDDRAGLLGAQAFSEQHGWSVPRRLEVARRLQQGFADGAEYAAMWDAKLPAIRAAYPGLELTRQMGLVPLEADPASGLWEFWHVASGARPERGEDGAIQPTGEMGIVLVLIPRGTFTMGAQSTNPDGKNYDRAADMSKESPPHEVTVDAFFLSKYEMTQGQWQRFVGSNKLTPVQELRYGLDRPILMVNWTEANRTMSRLGLRLPHEEQWEYAAHGPDGHPVHPWPSGNASNPFQGFANLNDASVPDDWKQRVRDRGQGPPVDWDDEFPFNAPVGTPKLQPNPFGLHNVYGNVAEAVSNSYYDYVTGESRMGHRRMRMARGGYFWAPAAAARPAFRAFEGTPEATAPYIGLRPARDIDP